MLTRVLLPWGRGCVLATSSSGANSVRGQGCHAQLCPVFGGKDVGELAQVPGEEAAPVDLEVASLERKQLGEMEGSQDRALAHLLMSGLCFVASVHLL